MAVLGKDNKTKDYFPGPGGNLSLGDRLNWNLRLDNHMNEIKYISIKFKLINATGTSPNATSCTPSQSPTILEVKRVMKPHEKWIYPLNWSLEGVNKTDSTTSIREMTINSVTYSLNIYNNIDSRFRLIIEIWSYSNNKEDFIFSWEENGHRKCTWNLLWFNIID